MLVRWQYFIIIILFSWAADAVCVGGLGLTVPLVCHCTELLNTWQYLQRHRNIFTLYQRQTKWWQNNLKKHTTGNIKHTYMCDIKLLALTPTAPLSSACHTHPESPAPALTWWRNVFKDRVVLRWHTRLF